MFVSFYAHICSFDVMCRVIWQFSAVVNICLGKMWWQEDLIGCCPGG